MTCKPGSATADSVGLGAVASSSCHSFASPLRFYFRRLQHAIEKERLHLQRAADVERERREAGSTFLAMMSHELRTPIHALLGFAELLHDTPLTTEQVELLRTVQSSGSTLLALVNDILEVSKLEVGAVRLEARPFSMHSCIEDVCGMLSTKVSHHDGRAGRFLMTGIRAACMMFAASLCS